MRTVQQSRIQGSAAECTTETGEGTCQAPFALAHRAFCAAAILARPSGEICRLPFLRPRLVRVGLLEESAVDSLPVECQPPVPRIPRSSVSRVAICSEIAMARFRCSMEGVAAGIGSVVGAVAGDGHPVT